ncbi:MAG: Oxidoreductase family NAD-binding Rossmann fold protein [Puniceicoccaceae bacterium 5H]|nr:MAG: Oxidoreductase family NAD-binding Rossmann fold protein [Puniceicoccaceae bacterium 5H]
MESSASSAPCFLPPPIRVGLVGVTGYAQAYFESLRKLEAAGRIQWGAVTIINREQAREQVRYFEARKVPIYDGYEAMLAQEHHRLDWMCIPTAIGWHTRMTIDSLRHGLPVLVEKPLAATLQEVDAIQVVERETGLLVVVGFQHTYLPGTWEIKQRLLAGEIGEIYRIDSIGLWPRGESYYQRNYWAGRLHDGASWVLDSPLQNALSHAVNLILFFAGARLTERAELVEVAAELYRSKRIESYDTIRTEAQLSSGARASIVLSHSSEQSVDPEIRFLGTQGTFTWRFSGEHVFEVDGRTDILRTCDHIPMRELMFETIVRHLQGEETQYLCTTELAKGEVKWVNAVHDTAMIYDIPGRFRRRRVDREGEIFDFVDQLDTYAQRAYERRCWLATAGAPWAVSPGRRDLCDYRAFEGKFLEPPPPQDRRRATRD